MIVYGNVLTRSMVGMAYWLPHSLGLIQINHVHVAWPVHCIRDVKTDIKKLIAISKYAHSRGDLFRPFDTPALNSVAYSKYQV